MRSIFLLLATMLLAANVNAQNNDIVWQHSYGGSNDDVTNSVCQTADGGYVVASTSISTDGQITNPKGLGDCWIGRLDANGDMMWQRSLGGSGSDGAVIIKYTTDGGCIMGAITNSTDGDLTNTMAHGQTDAWIVKLDSAGNIMWQQRLGGSDLEYLNDLQVTKDGGYIAIGETYSRDGDFQDSTNLSSDVFVVKLTNSGAISWLKKYGGSSYDGGMGICEKLIGGYVFCANTNSNDGQVNGYHAGTGHDVWIVDLNDTGAINWSHCYGGNDDDQAGKIIATSDKNYVMLGGTFSNNSGDIGDNHGSKDLWILKVDQDGVRQWSRNYGGTLGEEYGTIVNTPDSHGYIFSGSTVSADGDIVNAKGNDDLWVVRVNDTGAVSWSKNYGGSGLDEGNWMVQTKDSCIVIGGTTTSIDGDVTQSYGSGDCWVVKLKEAPLSAVTTIDKQPDILVYPTETNGLVHVVLPSGFDHSTLSLTDMSGRNISISQGGNGPDRIIKIEKTSSGVYLLQIHNRTVIERFKIVYKP